MKKINLARNIRHDSIDSLFLGEQLLSRQAEAMETLYAATKAMQLVPMNTDHPDGARATSYALEDVQGEALIVADKAKRPRLEVNAQEFLRKVRTIAISYCYSVGEIEAAQMAGVDLSGKEIRRANELVLRAFDKLVAYGSATDGIASGFANDPNVVASPIVTPWTDPAKTAQEIVDEFGALKTDLVNGSLGVHEMADTFAAPSAVRTAMMSKRLADSDMSALRWIEENHNVEVVSWEKLSDSAGDGTNVTKGILYQRSMDNLKCDLVKDVTALDLIQDTPSTFVGEVELRTSGCVFTRPLSARALTGI